MSRPPLKQHRVNRAAKPAPATARLLAFGLTLGALFGMAFSAGVVMTAATAPAFAETTPGTTAATLSAGDRADLKRIESYLEGLGTLEARFVQMASDGGYAEGTLHLDRPGKLRIDYDPPMPVQIIARRGTLIYFDTKLKQVSYVSTDATPAGLLLDKDVSLQKDAVVTAFERGAGTLRVSVVRRDEPNAGTLTLVFSDKPLTLRKWIVDDAQGIQTGVTLVDTRFGVAQKPELFEFRDPNFFKDSLGVGKGG